MGWLGIETGICHAANSAATIDMPWTHMDMVRTGIATYGYYPSDEILKEKIRLKPALALMTRIIHLKEIPVGYCVGYGSSWKPEKEALIATLPIGYADGLRRLFSSRGFMLVKGFPGFTNYKAFPFIIVFYPLTGVFSLSSFLWRRSPHPAHLIGHSGRSWGLKSVCCQWKGLKDPVANPPKLSSFLF